jgi:hypothetical protein
MDAQILAATKVLPRGGHRFGRRLIRSANLLLLECSW